MNTTQCPRCKKFFASRQRLQSHLSRKTPCENNKIINVNKGGRPPKIKEEIPNNDFKVNSKIHLSLDENTGNSTVLFGSSKSGKSTLLMHLYKKYYKKTISVLFTESPQIKLYKDKNLIISPIFFTEVIKEMHLINKGTNNHYDFTVLLDDIVDQKNNVAVKKLILILRNSNISSIVSLQSPKLLAKENRGSVNNYCFFKFNSNEMITEIIQLFLSPYLPPKKMDDKIKLYKKLTEDHKFIYLDILNDKISIHKINI